MLDVGKLFGLPDLKDILLMRIIRPVLFEGTNAAILCNFGPRNWSFLCYFGS